MYMIAERLHVGKFIICEDLSLIISPELPTVVYIDVGPAMIGQFVSHGSGGSLYFFIADAETPAIPAIPAQGGRERDLITADNGEAAGGGAGFIFHGELQGIIPFFRNSPRDEACELIQGKCRRQACGRISSGFFSCSRYLVEEGRAGPYSVYFRAIDAGRCAG